MNLHGICLNCFSVKGDYEICPYCGYIENTMPSEPYLLYPGMVLQQRYVVGTVLGVGGFGATYKAWDSKLSVIVAIKEFYPAGLVNRIPGEYNVMLFSGDKQNSFTMQLERFLDEARNMAKFTGDKNIVNVFDFFRENNTAYIVMEYLEGSTLKEFIASQGGKIDIENAMSIFDDILLAVDHIHSKGIIHRDISPDNIFILSDGRVKVLDFGAARFSDNENSELTQSVVIKMGYAPPEQYRSNMKQGVWTDIYALGATLYKMLTGVTPEESVDRMEKDTLLRPTKAGASVSLEIEKLIMKAMALKPELRIKSVKQMQEIMAKNISIDFPEDELKKRRYKRTGIIILSVVLFLTLGSYAGYKSTRSTGDTLADIAVTKGKISMDVPTDSTYLECYSDLAETFHEKYPEYTVEIVQNKENATIFDASENQIKPADLSLLIDSLDKENYWFFDKYETYYNSKNVIPLGFDFMTVFADDIALGDNGVALPDNVETKTQLSELTDQVSTDSIYLDFGSSLRQVQQKWPGYYAVIPYYEEGHLSGEFTDEWSINASESENQQKIAMLFLHFLLSDYAQNYMHVQQDMHFPVNKKALEQYIEINQDYDFLDQGIKKMNIVVREKAESTNS